ncbi:hypothetical protein TSAR_012664 [Trichomalopsis sarcophagae]|uniref:Hydroxylysine kinase n=1 Tax=Trichomalopsis sarcophagae TaxID=543379 RepID=A0A232FG72_9HYME|nr:hypothetical protein TSAR_012664 [Trichomalopsis sarcophagae]
MCADANVLTPGQQIKAVLSEDEASRLVELRYGLQVKRIVELVAYDDCNYRVICEDRICDNPHVSEVSKDGYVLKIVNSLDSQKTGFFEAQNELLIFLSKKGFTCPVPVKQTDGSYYSVETIGENGARHILRLLVYRPGEVLCNVPATPELLKKVGLFTAQLNKTLEEFSHSGYDNHTSLWVLPAVPRLREFMFALEDKSQVELVEQVISSFEQRVLSILASLDKGIIHGDLNEDNLIVTADGRDVEAVIDFGDSHCSCFVFELAICLCYMITQSKSLEMAKHVIEGYLMAKQLSQQERQILKVCVCARFCQSLVMGSYSYQREPNNYYLIKAHEVKWKLLRQLWSMSDQEVMALWGIQD